MFEQRSVFDGLCSQCFPNTPPSSFVTDATYLVRKFRSMSTNTVSVSFFSVLCCFTFPVSISRKICSKTLTIDVRNFRLSPRKLLLISDFFRNYLGSVMYFGCQCCMFYMYVILRFMKHLTCFFYFFHCFIFVIIML